MSARRSGRSRVVAGSSIRRANFLVLVGLLPTCLARLSAGASMSSADIVAASTPTIVAGNAPTDDILTADRELGSKSSKTKSSKSKSSKTKSSKTKSSKSKSSKKKNKKSSVFKKAGESSSQSKKNKSSSSSKLKKMSSSTKVSTLNCISCVSCSHIPLVCPSCNSLHKYPHKYSHIYRFNPSKYRNPATKRRVLPATRIAKIRPSPTVIRRISHRIWMILRRRL